MYPVNILKMMAMLMKFKKENIFYIVYISYIYLNKIMKVPL